MHAVSSWLVINAEIVKLFYDTCIYRCSVCEKCLSNWYFEKNGKLYCKQDYWTLYQTCNRCSSTITGPVMVSYNVVCLQGDISVEFDNVTLWWYFSGIWLCDCDEVFQWHFIIWLCGGISLESDSVTVWWYFSGICYFLGWHFSSI